MGRGDNILKLLGSEDVNTNKVTLGMSVLASFGGRNLHNLQNIKKKISTNMRKKDHPTYLLVSTYLFDDWHNHKIQTEIS